MPVEIDADLEQALEDAAEQQAVAEAHEFPSELADMAYAPTLPTPVFGPDEVGDVSESSSAGIVSETSVSDAHNPVSWLPVAMAHEIGYMHRRCGKFCKRLCPRKPIHITKLFSAAS